MEHWHQRENRKAVRIGVRLRTDGAWFDATVRNVSSGGMMLDMLEPLRRNQFVEIARGHMRVIGRIVWSDDALCGLQSRENIDIADLLGASPAPQGERRVAPRPPAARARPTAIGAQSDAARRVGQVFEWVVAGIVGIAVSAFAAGSAYDALSAPLVRVAATLEAAPG